MNQHVYMKSEKDGTIADFTVTEDFDDKSRAKLKEQYGFVEITKTEYSKLLRKQKECGMK